jgi:hypothetical protein
LPVPAVRAQARIAGFAIMYANATQTAPFATMNLRVAEEGLVIQDDKNGLRGVYVKPR